MKNMLCSRQLALSSHHPCLLCRLAFKPQVALVSLLVLSLTGCGSTESDPGQVKNTASSTGVSAPKSTAPANPAPLRETAQENASGSAVESSPIEDSPQATKAVAWPLFRADVHSTGAVEGELGTTMELAWQHRLTKGGFIGGPIIGNGRVFAVDMDGQCLALNAATGEVVWETKLEAFVDASPALHDERLYFGDLDGFLFCLDATKGETLWKKDLSTSFITSVNFDESDVIAVGETGDVFRIRAPDGEVLWKFPTEDRILSSPSIIDGHCFLTGCNSRLYAISLDQPVIEKNHELSSPTGVTAALIGDFAYFSESGGNVLCMNWKSGEILWSYPLTQGGEEVKSCPAVNDDLVIIGGGSNRKLVAIDRQTGKERWTFTTRRMLNSSPIVVGDAVAFGGHDGRLYVLDLKSGEKRFEFECGGVLSASPAFGDGKLVVSNDQGAIFCFRPAASIR